MVDITSDTVLRHAFKLAASMEIEKLGHVTRVAQAASDLYLRVLDISEVEPDGLTRAVSGIIVKLHRPPGAGDFTLSANGWTLECFRHYAKEYDYKVKHDAEPPFPILTARLTGDQQAFDRDFTMLMLHG